MSVCPCLCECVFVHAHWSMKQRSVCLCAWHQLWGPWHPAVNSRRKSRMTEQQPVRLLIKERPSSSTQEQQNTTFPLPFRPLFPDHSFPVSTRHLSLTGNANGKDVGAKRWEEGYLRKAVTGGVQRPSKKLQKDGGINGGMHENNETTSRQKNGYLDEDGRKKERDRYWKTWGVMCVCAREWECGIWQALLLAFIGELINPQPFDSCQTPPRTHTHSKHTTSPSVWLVPVAPFQLPSMPCSHWETSLFNERCERETDGQT